MKLRKKTNEPITVELMQSWSVEDDKTGCWNWLKAKANYGYGHLTYLGIGYNAHRLIFILSNPNEDVSEKDICHKCDNPACIKPDHLFAAQHHENMKDMKRKGRSGVAERTKIIKPEPDGNWVKGAAHRDAKLNPEKVKRIRQLLSDGYGYRKLGEMFEVDRTTIRGVAQGRYWKHVQ